MVNTRTNQPVTGYPTRQDVDPLGMLSFDIPVAPTDLGTLVRTTKKNVEGALGKVDGITSHVDIDISVNPEMAKAKAALKELQEIAAKLPDNSAMLLAQSTLAILTAPQGFD